MIKDSGDFDTCHKKTTLQSLTLTSLVTMQFLVFANNSLEF